MSLSDLHRPDPVVFLRLAFSDQLSVDHVSSRSSLYHASEQLAQSAFDVHFLIPADGYPQLEHVCF